MIVDKEGATLQERGATLREAVAILQQKGAAKLVEGTILEKEKCE